jgi:hypothetical protein
VPDQALHHVGGVLGRLIAGGDDLDRGLVLPGVVDDLQAVLANVLLMVRWGRSSAVPMPRFSSTACGHW